MPFLTGILPFVLFDFSRSLEISSSECDITSMNDFASTMDYETNLVGGVMRLKCKRGMKFAGSDEAFREVYCEDQVWKYRYIEQSYRIEVPNSAYQCAKVEKWKCDLEKIKIFFNRLNYIRLDNTDEVHDDETLAYSCLPSMKFKESPTTTKKLKCSGGKWFEDDDGKTGKFKEVDFSSEVSECEHDDKENSCDGKKLVKHFEENDFVITSIAARTESFTRVSYRCKKGMRVSYKSESTSILTAYCIGHNWYSRIDFEKGNYCEEEEKKCDESRLKRYFERLNYNYTKLDNKRNKQLFSFSCKNPKMYERGYDKKFFVYCYKKDWYEDTSWITFLHKKVNTAITEDRCKRCSFDALRKFMRKNSYYYKIVEGEIRLYCANNKKMSQKNRYRKVYCDDGQWKYDYYIFSYSIDVPYRSYECIHPESSNSAFDGALKLRIGSMKNSTNHHYCNITLAKEFLAGLDKYPYLANGQNVTTNCFSGYYDNIVLSCIDTELWLDDNLCDNIYTFIDYCVPGGCDIRIAKQYLGGLENYPSYFEDEQNVTTFCKSGALFDLHLSCNSMRLKVDNAPCDEETLKRICLVNSNSKKSTYQKELLLN